MTSTVRVKKIYIYYALCTSFSSCSPTSCLVKLQDSTNKQTPNGVEQLRQPRQATPSEATEASMRVYRFCGLQHNRLKQTPQFNSIYISSQLQNSTSIIKYLICVEKKPISLLYTPRGKDWTNIWKIKNSYSIV